MNNSKVMSIEYDGIDCCVEEISRVVQRLVRNLKLFERDQIKVHGFTSSQCYVLLELLKSPGLTMNELSDRMNLDNSTMSRVVKILVRDGFILRDRDEADRRIILAYLTEEGKSVARKLNEELMKYYQSIVTEIPTGEVDAVLSAVTTLMDALERVNPNCC